MHHLCNIWFGNMEKKFTTQLNCILRSSLDEIVPTLRVLESISALIRAIDKEFSLLSNYPKLHGELFLLSVDAGKTSWQAPSSCRACIRIEIRSVHGRNHDNIDELPVLCRHP
jgi:hypothetical protein